MSRIFILLLVAILYIIRVVLAEEPLHFVECKKLTHIRCKDGLTCIHKRWMCDGRIDCPDHSDELPNICGKRGKTGNRNIDAYYFSPNRRCPPNYFFCKDASVCLQPQRVCDGNNDCRDGSDEAEFCYELRTRMQRIESHTIVY